MKKVAIICNVANHVRTVLGLNPMDPRILIIQPHETRNMYGVKDIYYYELRPMYYDEKSYAEDHEWKSINKQELYEILETKN